jgi:hypothetical protein
MAATTRSRCERPTKSHLESLIHARDLPANAHILATNLINAIDRGAVTRDHDERLAIGKAIRKLHLVAVRREFCGASELDIQDSVEVGLN